MSHRFANYSCHRVQPFQYHSTWTAPEEHYTKHCPVHYVAPGTETCFMVISSPRTGNASDCRLASSPQTPSTCNSTVKRGNNCWSCCSTTHQLLCYFVATLHTNSTHPACCLASPSWYEYSCTHETPLAHAFAALSEQLTHNIPIVHSW